MFIIFFDKLKLKIHAEYIEGKGDITIDISFLFGFFKKRISVGKKEDKPEKKRKKNKKKKSEKEHKKFKLNLIYKALKAIYAYLKNRVKIYDTDLKIALGFEDAAATGVVSGYLYILIGIFKSFINQNFIVKNDKYVIKSVFGRNIANISFSCIVEVKDVHIIRSGIKFIKIYKLK